MYVIIATSDINQSPIRIGMMICTSGVRRMDFGFLLVTTFGCKSVVLEFASRLKEYESVFSYLNMVGSESYHFG